MALKGIKNPPGVFDVMQHGKNTLAINLKDARGQDIVQRLSKHYDVLIDPFRPGVLEKLNLGSAKLCAAQPRLIYASLTGFGQQGRLAARAGHDINYAAISGVLSMLGRHGEPPQPPVNILADFAGGGLMCAMGILLALLERHHSGKGQLVDAAMIDGASYVASWLFISRMLPMWGRERGRNALDGGWFYYDVYETKDGKYMSVGAIEPQFFEIFKEHLSEPQLTQYINDAAEQQAARSVVKKAFLRRTQAEWSQIFENIDACVYPVLDWQDAWQHDHNRARQSFDVLDNDVIMPKPAPRLSRTPGEVKTHINSQKDINEILELLQFKQEELQQLLDAQVLLLPQDNAKL